jgi:hypothetical protein
MAYEDIALADQPHSSHDQRKPIGIGHEAALDGKLKRIDEDIINAVLLVLWS